MKVLVIGGTGELGRSVVPRLRARGHDVWVGTRTPLAPDHVRVNLTVPATLDAVAGHDVVVHLAADARAAAAVDVAGTAALVRAVAAHRVGHLLLLSIVGIDGHPWPFFRARAAAERVVEEAGVPHTILRATQFHTLVGRFLDELPRSPLLPVPRRVLLRPVDPDVVADRVVELVGRGPAGRVADVTGPEVVPLDELVRRELRARGRRAVLVPVPLRGRWARAFRDGRMLGDHPGRGGTHADHLAAVPRPATPAPDVLLRALAVAWGALAVTIAAVPDGVHTTVATFGAPNPHLFRDVAALSLPYGLALWLAASRPPWRRPAIAMAAGANALHLASHLVDVAAAPLGVTVGNLLALVAAQVLLAVAWRRSAGRGRGRAAVGARPGGRSVGRPLDGSVLS